MLADSGSAELETIDRNRNGRGLLHVTLLARKG
jgi:hypothetical protein